MIQAMFDFRPLKLSTLNCPFRWWTFLGSKTQKQLKGACGPAVQAVPAVPAVQALRNRTSHVFRWISGKCWTYRGRLLQSAKATGWSYWNLLNGCCWIASGHPRDCFVWTMFSNFTIFYPKDGWIQHDLSISLHFPKEGWGAPIDQSFFGAAQAPGDGTDTLFKANVVAGGILALTEVDGKDPDILLRAGSGQKRMLTIMEGNGSYFGKIEIADSRGMVLYHMQKPCATITADVKDLSMQVYPLSADAKFLRAASMIKKGERLRIQVSKNFDASLLLGCLLGIVILEPDLMKRACHH